MRIWLVLFSVLATVALAESTLSLQPSPPPCAATLSMSPATIVLGEDITYTWSFSGHQPTHVYISLSAGCKYNDDGPCKYHGSRTVLANESPYTWTTAGWDLDHSVSWGPSWPSLTGYIESADASGRDGGCWDYASVNGGVGDRTDTLGSGSTNTSIALGDRHSCALLTNGTMKCWGSNYYGQLGDGSYVTVHPKPICRRHTQKIYQQILLLIHQQQRDLPPITRQVFNPPQIL
jgi:hypothetical protein